MKKTYYFYLFLHFILATSFTWLKLVPTISSRCRIVPLMLPIIKTVENQQHASIINNNNSSSSQRNALLSKADIKFLSALHIYQSLYHTTNVPYLFVVPESSSDWPTYLWSYSLGVKANHVRHQGKTKNALVLALESAGFQWSARNASIQRLIDALEIFKRRFGHTKVLTQYKIPQQSLYSVVFGQDRAGPSSDPASVRYEWPRELHSLRLGTKWRRYLAESEGVSSETDTLIVSRELATWSSVLDPVDGKSTKLTPVSLECSVIDTDDHAINGLLRPDGYTHIERIVVALEYFRYHFGDRAIPEDLYIDDAGIPSSCTYDTEVLSRAVPWPDSLRDLHVGKWLRNPSLSQIPLAQNVSVALSKVVPTSSYEKFMLDLTALEHFKSLHGHLNVPSFFVVPNDAQQEWPIQMQGLKLGYNVRQIRKGLRHNTPAQIARLRDVGLNLTRSSRQQNFDKTLRALDTHNRLFGDLLVPRYFVVPIGDGSWPRDTWGLRLGSRVNSIRAGTSCTSPEQRAQLKEIGFIVE